MVISIFLGDTDFFFHSGCYKQPIAKKDFSSISYAMSDERRFHKSEEAVFYLVMSQQSMCVCSTLK